MKESLFPTSEGIQLTRSFNTPEAPVVRRSSSAPPSRTRKANASPRKQPVPWIPNASSSNVSYNTLTKQYFKKRSQIVMNSKPQVLNVFDSTLDRKDSPLRRSSTLSSGSLSPHLVETFIGGKYHVLKINSPLSSPAVSPRQKPETTIR